MVVGGYLEVSTEAMPCHEKGLAKEVKCSESRDAPTGGFVLVKL